MWFDIHSYLLWLIRDAGKWGEGYLCPSTPTNHTARHDHQKDGQYGVSFNVSTVVGNKATKTVSEDTVLNLVVLSELPSPPLTHSVVSSLWMLQTRYVESIHCQTLWFSGSKKYDIKNHVKKLQSKYRAFFYRTSFCRLRGEADLFWFKSNFQLLKYHTRTKEFCEHAVGFMKGGSSCLLA